MKKLINIAILTLGLTAMAQAHHNSPSTSAGGSMSDMSGHLELFIG